MSAPPRATRQALAAARHFYALPLDAATLARCTETFPSRMPAELVAAHLVPAQRSSSLAHSLSGFFILERHGPTQYMVDLRDSGQVYRQDSERGLPQLAFDSLIDFREFQAARDGPRDREECDDEQLAAGFRPRSLAAKENRSPTTLELYVVYQWIARLFGPVDRRSNTPEDEEAGMSAYFAFTRTFADRDDEGRSFGKARPRLTEDPQLALYWLLHSSILGDSDSLATVRELLTASSHPLVQAFLGVFGQLAADDEISYVPTFRQRRSWLLYYLAISPGREDPERLRLALQIAPDDNGFHKAAKLVRVARQTTAIDSLSTFSAAHSGPQLGFVAFTALLDKHAGATSSVAADAVLRAWPSGERPEHLAQCLVALQPLASDRYRVRVLVDRALAENPTDWLAVQVGLAAAERDGDEARTASLAARRAALAEVRPTFLLLTEGDPDAEARGLAAFAGLAPAPCLTLARCVLHYRHVRDLVLAPAVAEILATGDAAVLAELHAAVRDPVRVTSFVAACEALRPEGLRGDEDPLWPLVRALAELSEGEDVWQHYWKNLLVGLLRPVAHTPTIFAWSLAAIVDHNRPRLQEELLSLFGDPDGVRVMSRLTDDQADTLVRVLARLSFDNLEINAVHLDMAWMHFGHPGGVPAIVELLESADEPRIRGHLYSGLASVEHPNARHHLHRRLFTEQRTILDLCWNLGEVLDDTAHAAILAELARTRSHLAAVNYVAVFTDFFHCTRRSPHVPVAAIAEAMLRWPEPDNLRDRGRRRYILRLAARLAIEHGDHDLVRRAHHAAQAITAPPYSDYHEQHADGTVDPFADDIAMRRRLVAILAGRPPAGSLSTSRRRTTISDGVLEQHMGVPLASRLLTTATGQVWCLDRADRLWTFDGTVAAVSSCRFVSGIRDLAHFLADAHECAEHLVQWSPDARELRDIARYHDRLLLLEMGPEQRLATRGIIAPTPEAAADLYTVLARHPPSGWTTWGAWHHPGRGAVVREYMPRHAPDVELKPLGDRPDEYVRLEAQALELMRRAGTAISRVGWTPELRRLDDTGVLAYLDDCIADGADHPATMFATIAACARTLLEHGWTTAIPEFPLTDDPLAARNIATAFVDALAESCPLLSMIPCDARYHPGLIHHQLRRGAMFWELLFDPETCFVSTRRGKLDAAGSVHLRRFPDATSAHAYHLDLLRARQREGYRAIRSGSARNRPRGHRRP